MKTKPAEINVYPLPIGFRCKESARKFVDEVFPTGYAKKDWVSDGDIIKLLKEIPADTPIFTNPELREV